MPEDGDRWRNGGVNSNQSVIGVQLTTAAGASISGQVFRQGTSQPIAGATITASNEAGGPGFVLISDANGNYDFTGLSAGVFDLVVDAPGYARAVLRGVDVTASNAVETISLVDESALTGTVNVANGGPGFGTLHVMTQPSGNTDPHQLYSVSSTLNSFSLGGLPGGTYDITLSLTGYITQTIASVVVPGGQSVSLGTVTLAPASEIDGTVTSSDSNNPAAGILIQGLQGSTVIGSALADGSGNFQILNLPAGTYTLALPAATGAFVTALTVTVAQGQTVTGEAIVVQPGGTISGSVVKPPSSPIAGIPVYLSGPAGLALSTTTDSSGNYQFTGLGTGAYLVYLPLGGAQASQTVNVSLLDGTAVTANLQLSYSCGNTRHADERAGATDHRRNGHSLPVWQSHCVGAGQCFRRIHSAHCSTGKLRPRRQQRFGDV